MARVWEMEIRSFGSEVERPGHDTLAAWVSGRGCAAGDLITFMLEESLGCQHMLERPCAGGLFYGERIRGCITGIRDGVLEREPYADAGDVAMDASSITAHRKHAWVSLPAPSHLGVADGYFRDRDEFCGALCTLYARLLREMRDAGAGGHTLICDAACEAELESLSGKKIIFFLLTQTTESLSLLLEYQQEIAVFPDQLPLVWSLMEDYDIRKVIIMDPNPASIAMAMEYMDRDEIAAGGYCREECTDYWTGLRAGAVVRR